MPGRRTEKETLSMEAVNPTLVYIVIFVPAVSVGFHVVWCVTPALHAPLMAVSSAISALVTVGALLAAARREGRVARFRGVIAVALAAVNVFGGFVVARR